jgi:hypothetical protein
MIVVLSLPRGARFGWFGRAVVSLRWSRFKVGVTDREERDLYFLYVCTWYVPQDSR